MPDPTVIPTIKLRSGNSWEGSLTFYEDDGVTLADISGYSVRLELRRNPYDPEPSAVAIVTPNVPLSKFDMKILPASTLGLVGNYPFAVEVSYDPITIKTEIVGEFAITQDAIQ